MNLLQELTQEFNDTVDIIGALNEAVKELHLQSRGRKIKLKADNAKDFFKGDPHLSLGSMSATMDAMKQYDKNKRNTVKFFAKQAYEKKMITQLVDTMIKSKRYRLVKTKYAKGGKVWELKRVRQ